MPIVYILDECQIFPDGTVSILPTATFTDRDEAESAFYSKMASVKLSKLPCHSVYLRTSMNTEVLSGIKINEPEPSSEE